MSVRAPLVAALVLAASCGDPIERPWSEAERARIASLSPLSPPPPSPDNPYADDERAAELGRVLFSETRWSRDGATSCVTCHDPSRELSDGRRVARAQGVLTRNTPSLRGSAWMRWQGWDGSRDSVWSRSLLPLEHDAELGSSRARVARVVATHHADRYAAVFGPLPRSLAALPADAGPRADDPAHPHARAWAALAPGTRDAVDRVWVDVGRALEAYVRRLHPGEARFDRFVRALREHDPRETDLLTPAERRGLRAFIGEARCLDCHHGPLLSDGEFHNLALPPAIGVPDRDPGRAGGVRALLASEHRCGHLARARDPRAPECASLRFLDAESAELAGAFRTPSLRNVTRTAPYMHGGHLDTLRDVLELYRALPGTAPIGHRDGALRPLPRRVSLHDLEAFLATLDGEPLPARWRPP